MTPRTGHTPAHRRSRCDRGGRARARRRRAGGVSDRDGLRPRRRRHQRRSGRAALCGERPPALQSADLASAGREGRACARALRRRREAARRRVLARAFDAGAAEGGRLSGRRACDRRPRLRLRCGCRITRSRAIFSRHSASRWSRPRPIDPAMCRRRPRSMCSPISTAAST